MDQPKPFQFGNEHIGLNDLQGEWLDSLEQQLKVEGLNIVVCHSGNIIPINESENTFFFF